MATPLAVLLNELSPEDRERVERGAENLAVENRTLGAIRKALGVTQDQLADALETTQGNVAQIESKRDVMVSTVARIVNALGGDLHLIATFPGQPNPVRIWIGEQDVVKAKRVAGKTYLSPPLADKRSADPLARKRRPRSAA